MPALHPDVAATRTAVKAALGDLEPGALTLVALSGGADSLALCSAVAFVAPRAALSWGALIVDHGLQNGSADVAARAAEQARGLGASVVRVLSVRVDGPGGPEAAARDARRLALRQAAEQLDAAAVLMAHTLDDQAETVLLGLARGSGARSLAGMRPVEGLWRRPFLALPAQVTRGACVASALQPWNDPHNADPAFARVRVRRHLLPQLESSLGPGVAGALARTAALLRDDADLLDELAEQLGRDATTEAGSLDVRELAAAPPALRSRVLRSAAIRAGCPPTDLSAAHVRAVDSLVTAWRGQRGVDLPGGVVARRRDGALVFSGRG